MSTRFSHDLTYDAPLADVDAKVLKELLTRAAKAAGG